VVKYTKTWWSVLANVQSNKLPEVHVDRRIIIIIIIKYLYSANILKVQKRFTEVTLKILKTLLNNKTLIIKDFVAEHCIDLLAVS